MDARLAAQITLHIHPEDAHIGDAAAVDHIALAARRPRVPFGQLGLFGSEVVGEHIKAAQGLRLGVAQKADALLVQVDAALDAPPTRLRHAPPVAERIRNQALGGDVGDRLVPVLHLDRVQGNVDHAAVHPDLRHLNPVAHPHHVVRAELHTGHQRQQGILKDQHQHRRHRPQARQQDEGRTIDQRGDHQDGRQRINDDLDHLHIALDGPLCSIGPALPHRVDEVQQVGQRQRHRQHDEGPAHVLHHRDHRLRQLGHGLNAPRQHQGGHHMRQPRDHPQRPHLRVIRQGGGFQHPVHAAQQDVLGQPVGQPRQGDQGGQRQHGIGHRVAFQPRHQLRKTILHAPTLTGCR